MQTDVRRGMDALAELYAREYDAMVKVAYLIVGSAEIAEDCVQEAFVRVHRRWDAIDTPGAYLRTAVVNAARDHLRRRRVRRWMRPVDHGVDQDMTAGVEVERSLRRLSERQRIAVVLRYYVGLTDEQIASHLDCRPTTVRSLVHRGLDRLREALEP